MKGDFYKIKQSAEKAEVYIFGDISETNFWGDANTPTGIVNEIKELTAPVIDVYIDSYGGHVSAGWAIYNALLNHPAKINTYGTGFVASAALFPFLAGDNRFASNASAYYLHKVMMSAAGYAEDLRTAADEADKLTDIGVNVFTDRAGMDKDTVLALMEKETWLSPTEALEHGIATAIIQEKEEKYSQNVKMAVMQKLTAEEKPTPPAPGSSLSEMLTGIF